MTENDDTADIVMSDANIVKQTIVETLETPRLLGIDVSGFVSFKEKREIYERKVKQKAKEQKLQLTPNFL